VLLWYNSDVNLLLHQSAYLLHGPPKAAARAGDQGVLCIKFLVLVFKETFSSKFIMVPSVKIANKHGCYISIVMEPRKNVDLIFGHDCIELKVAGVH